MITIESAARDILDLIQSLGWNEVALCGFSMGGEHRHSRIQIAALTFMAGLVAQQLILFPFHSTRPTTVPFRITHLVLASATTAPLSKPPKIPTTSPVMKPDERLKKYKYIVGLSFDPTWLADPKNASRFEELVSLMPHKPTQAVCEFSLQLRVYHKSRN